MKKTTLELVEPRLSQGRFSSLEALTDEALFRQTGVRIAFTGRTGGVSTGPYASLNLGAHVKDDPACVGENRRRAMEAFGAEGFPLIVPNQVHGDVVLTVDEPAAVPCIQKAADEGADGIVVTCAGVASLLCFADCMPVIVVSPSGAFAVVHAGWRGVMAQIAAKAVGALLEADRAQGEGTTADMLNVYVGPHIQAECFETSSEIHDEFVRTFGSACSAGPRHVSLVAAQRESLSRVGVDMRRVADAGICTVCCNDAYYSYRAQEGVCGRHGAFAFRAQ